MPEISDFEEEFGRSLGAPHLPEGLSERYETISALGHKPGGGAWLIRRRSDGAQLVLKISGGGGENLEEEFRLMERLPEDIPVPRAVELCLENGVQYLVRTCLPGKSMDEAWETGPDPGYRRWAETGAALCALLERLHGLEPPVVHRDIKPENIILSPEGAPGLIDFGIARRYDPERDCDTAHMGTRTTAAPEQYGFAQSDCRTDLYSLGVTLRWMVTGSYRPQDLDSAPCPRWVKRFLRRAAAFDPADRFPTAAAMGAALRRRSAPLRRSLAAVLLALCLAAAAGLLVCQAVRGRAVEFASPLLEAAVRAELNMAEGTVTRGDLSRVRRLAVVGQEIMDAGQSYEYRLCGYLDGAIQTDSPRGELADLSLLADMPNLTMLYLCGQEIRDISPLAGLPLRELYLCDNRIQDLSPLEELPELETLFLGSNPAGDLSPLAGLESLRVLNLDSWDPGRQVDSLRPLAGLKLTCLSVGNTVPADGDWSPLGHLENLEVLWLWDPDGEAVAALGACRSGLSLHLGNYGGPDLTDLPVIPGLISLSAYGRLPSIDGIGRQTGLTSVGLCGQPDMDLTPLTALEHLTHLSISDCPISDFSPLAELPALSEVDLQEANRTNFEASCPHPAFSVIYS